MKVTVENWAGNKDTRECKHVRLTQKAIYVDNVFWHQAGEGIVSLDITEE